MGEAAFNLDDENILDDKYTNEEEPSSPPPVPFMQGPKEPIYLRKIEEDRPETIAELKQAISNTQDEIHAIYLDPELKNDTAKAHGLREELEKLESNLTEYKTRIEKKMPEQLDSLKRLYENKKQTLQTILENQEKTGTQNSETSKKIVDRYHNEIAELEKKLEMDDVEDKIPTQKIEEKSKVEVKPNFNIDSIINSLITFGESNQYQPSDDTLIDLALLPKEQVKQIMEETMNKFNDQQKNLPQESRFKKVLSFFRGKSDIQKREDSFLNGFAKLQTTIFKASPEVLDRAVAKGIANKESVGQIEDNLTSNAGYNIEKEKIK